MRPPYLNFRLVQQIIYSSPRYPRRALIICKPIEIGMRKGDSAKALACVMDGNAWFRLIGISAAKSKSRLANHLGMPPPVDCYALDILCRIKPGISKNVKQFLPNQDLVFFK